MIQIQWTAQNLKEAKQVVRSLIEKKWVACANLIPVVSIYTWEGSLEEGNEIKVFLKTKDEYFCRIRDYIIDEGAYEVPEVSKFLIADANPMYIDWLSDSLI